jgi:hypothetical protein
LQLPAWSETISTSFELSNSNIDEDADQEDVDSAIVSHQNPDVYIYSVDVSKAFYDFQLLVQRKIIQDESLQYMWGKGEAKKGGEKKREEKGFDFRWMVMRLTSNEGKK